MKRLSLLTFLLILSGISLQLRAQGYDDILSVYGTLPKRMVNEACTKVTSATSQCNTGTEPFSQFLRKFKTDRTFRNSRIAVTEKYGNPDWIVENINFIKDWTSTFKFPVYQRKTRCDHSFATWYGVEKDIVYYYLNDVFLCQQDGGSSYNAIFRRIDGKWYLTNLIVVG